MIQKFLLRSLLLMSLMIVFSTQSYAAKEQAPCSIGIDLIKYKGPFATLFDGEGADQKDCSYPADVSPLNDEVVQSGKLTCTKGYLDPSIVGKKENLRYTNGTAPSGQVSLGDVSTYALGGKLLDKEGENADKLTTFQKAVEAYRNYDLTSLYREAYWEGVTILDDFLGWAQKKGLTIDGRYGPHLNPSIYAARQQQVSLRDQIIEIIRNIGDIQDCNTIPGFANTHRCSPNYLTKRGSNERVLDLANSIGSILKISDPMGTWEKLTKAQKFQALTLHVTRSSPTFVVFVPYDSMCRGGFFDCLFGWLKSQFESFFTGNTMGPTYIKAMLPETTNILEGVNDEYNRFNALGNNTNPPQAASPTANLSASNTIVSDVTSDQPQLLAAKTDSTGNGIYVAPTDDPLLNKLILRAINEDPECGKGPINTTENLGSTADPTKNKSFFEILFGQKGHDVPSALNQMKLYHVYLFSPPDIVSAHNRMSSDNNSIFRKLLPLNTTGFETEIYVPEKFNGYTTDQDASFDTPTGKYIEVKNENGGVDLVPEMEPNYIKYTNTLDKATQPGGPFSTRAKWETFGSFRPLNSFDNIKDQSKCLLEEHLQPHATQNGFDLITSINASQFPQTNCPNPIKVAYASTASSSGDINCIKNIPINPSEYGICSVDAISNLASRWVGGAGKHYVNECIGDVVTRAEKAGVAADLAVYMWIHESGASNYTWWEGLGKGKTLEDFGIHGSSSAPPENFSAQLDYFLSIARGINAHCASEMQQYGMLNSFYSNLWFGECNPESTKMETRNGVTKSIKEWMETFKTDAANTWRGVSCR